MHLGSSTIGIACKPRVDDIRIHPALFRCNVRMVPGGVEIEGEYLDVLQNIESAIVMVDEEDSTLLDLMVIEALAALICVYSAEDEGCGVGQAILLDRAQRVFNLARHAWIRPWGRQGDLDCVLKFFEGEVKDSERRLAKKRDVCASPSIYPLPLR